jgi:hypothetical protein
VGLELRPNTGSKVILHGLEQPWTDLGEREFVTGNWIVGMLVESPTGFGCPNQGRAELWREEADGDQFGSDDSHGSRRIGRVLISKNAFNVPEGSVVG